MSSFPANIPAKLASFFFGLGNKDNCSFQPNLDLTLPKRLILKLVTNYLSSYLFHPFQVGLNFSAPPHKNPTNVFSNFPLCLQNSFIFVSHVSRKEPPRRLAMLHLFTHRVLNTQGGNKKEGENLGRGCGNKSTCYIQEQRASVPEMRKALGLVLLSDAHSTTSEICKHGKIIRKSQVRILLHFYTLLSLPY